MIAPEVEPSTDDDLSALIRGVPTALVEVTPVYTARTPRAKPGAFCLRFADGRLLKGRIVSTAARAARIDDILQCLPRENFPKVVARRGRALLLEWIEGQPLHAGQLDAELLRACGALHGLVHGARLPDGCPHVAPTLETYHAHLARDVDALVRAGRLAASEARRARELAMHHAPSRVAAGVVHRDLCMDNMVMRRPGRVAVVDNETVAVGAYDFDLARTWYRWPMTAEARASYLDGYRGTRGPGDFFVHFPYWAISVVIESAVLRLHAPAPVSRLPLERLRTLVRALDRGMADEQLVLET